MNSACCLDHCEADHVGATQHDSDSSDKSDIRIEKILSVRLQFGEGRYDLADKLDVVVDRIIEELLQHS